MKHIATIFRRELAVYFHSPIGYMFMIVFLVFSLGLFITPFFTFPVAEMRGFFGLLPISLCIFIPAVTMRLWSEERKENTFEMLMTFPMKTYSIVLGKYLSALAFLTLTMVGTLIVPLMLAILGQPDYGQIISSYVGSFLLGSMLLAVGLFVSGLCKDQIVAFIVALLVCIMLYLAGTDFIATYADGLISGLGSLMGDLLGFDAHFQPFMRGMIEVTDILFFVIWTGLFLFLNGFYLEMRNKPEMKISFPAGLVLTLVLGMALNWVMSDLSLGRFDLTEGGVYTVSSSTKNILTKLKVPVNLKLYISPKSKMPTELRNLEQDIVDKIEEMRIVSKGNLKLDVIYLEASNFNVPQEGITPEKAKEKSKDEESVEKRLLDKGVKPFSARAIREDSVINVLIYSAVGIAYKDQKEEIIPQVVPQNIHELEYLIVSNVFKMTQEKLPTIAFVAPRDAYNIPPQMRKIYEQMGRPLPPPDDPYAVLQQFMESEKYKVSRVDMTEESPLPEQFDTLVIVNPRSLNDRQKFEINKALVEGKSVFLAVQKNMWNYQMTNGQVQITRQDESPNVDDLLEGIGTKLSNAILMDENHRPLTVSDPTNPMGFMGGVTLNLPIQIMLGPDSMNPEVSITSRLSELFYLWGSPFEVDEAKLTANQLKLTTLMTTSAKGWTVENTSNLTQDSFKTPKDGQKKIPVALMVEGQFPNAFKDKQRPAWPKLDDQGNPQPAGPGEDFKDYKSQPGKLILVGGSQMFTKNFLQRPNLDFFVNGVDALSLGQDLINVRSKRPISRVISKPSNGARTFWKFAHYILINAVVGGIGVIVLVHRKRRRDQYTMHFAQDSMQ